MWQQSGAGCLDGRVRQKTQTRLIVTGLVVLQAEMRDLIAHRKQEVILAIMRRAKQRPSLFDELPILCDQLRWRLERLIRIGSDIEIVCWRCTRTQFDPAEMTACENRRMHQRCHR